VEKQVAAGGDVGSSERVREGGYEAVGMMVGRTGVMRVLARFRCGFDAVAGCRGCDGRRRGGEIVEL